MVQNNITEYPKVISKWDFESNETSPEDVSISSHSNYNWICEKSHKYSSKPYIQKNSGCPVCSGRLIIVGTNDLMTLCPEIAKQWNYNKNEKLPSEYTRASRSKVWWVCDKGHEWADTIANRTRLGRGCSVCANRKVVKGVNDLATTRPDMLRQWDWERNTEYIPYEITSSCGKNIWWICEKGHSFCRTPNGRSKYEKLICPICSKEKKTSFPERVIFYFVKMYFSDAEPGRRDLLPNQKEIDIYIPSISVGIEYDGEVYHKSSVKDNLKDKFCIEAGIQLYRIREPKCPKLGGNSKGYWLKGYSESDLEEGILWLLHSLGVDVGSISIAENLDQIYELSDSVDKDNSLASKMPELAKEWNYNRNGKLNPYNVPFGSEKKVWWIDSLGHEWQSKIANRTMNKQGCPYCSVPAKKVLSGFNDFQTKHPELMGQWNYKKNVNIKPDEILPAYNSKVWWICEKGHEWEAAPATRTKGAGCPYCRGYYATDENRLTLLYPEIAAEWDYEKNDVSPDEVCVGSARKYWWKCSKCGESYLSNVVSRTGCSKTGCSICAGKVIVKGINDLGTKYSYLIDEYCAENELSIYEIATHSKRKYKWKCKSCNGIYEGTSSVQISREKCPLCKTVLNRPGKIEG